MFAPQGYVNFADFWGLLRGYAYLHCRLVLYREGGGLEMPDDEITQEWVADWHAFHMDFSILVGIVADRALHSGSSILFNPSGDIVKPARSIIRHQDDLQDYKWSYPIPDSGELYNLHQSYINKKFSGGPLNRWRFINSTTGTISIKHIEAELEAFQEQSLEDFSDQIPVARQLDGWAVCLDENYSFMQAFTDVAGITYKEAKEMEAKGPGRPNKINAAIEAYSLLPEEERALLTRKQLAAKIEEASGIKINPDVLGKAVNKLDRSADGPDKIN